MPEAEDWLARAKSCLALANSNVTGEVYREDLCFQAQQAAEKALKAIVIAKRVQPVPRTHDLVALLRVVASLVEIPEEVKGIVDLNDYAVMTRYPGEYAPVTPQELEQALASAKTCVDWCSTIVAKSPAKGREQGNAVD